MHLEPLLSTSCCIDIQWQNRCNKRRSNDTSHRQDGHESHSGILIIKKRNPRFCFAITPFVHVLNGESGAKKCSSSIIFHNLEHGSKDTSIKVQLNTRSNELMVLRADPVLSWKSHKFAQSFDHVFSPKQNWRCSYDTDQQSKSEQQDGSNEVEYLSWFTLLEMEFPNLLEISSRMFPCILEQCLSPASEVITRTYPFGPEVLETFKDTISAGIISNVAKGDALFMIDARCLPGSEGGGVYVRSLKDVYTLAGIIVSPLCWKTEELIGFTVCCSFNELISSLDCALQAQRSRKDLKLQRVRSLTCQWSHDLARDVSARQKLCGPDVVKIDVSGMWGSGVVVSATSSGRSCEMVVVTCRHVIQEAINKKTKIHVHVCGVGKSFLAEIVFAADEDSCFDLAVLTFNCHHDLLKNFNLELTSLNPPLTPAKMVHLTPHSLLKSDYVKGSAVYVKGYGLFDADSHLGPSLSSGVIANIAHGSVDIGTTNAGNESIPVLLHSTCAVHKGCSGGALFSEVNHKLQGIVVNHVRDETCKVSYPRVNFSIPTGVFMPAIGSAVYVKGYGLFDADSHLGPSLSSGVIANIAHGSVDIGTTNAGNESIPVLLHSTCAVHKGCSGGALFSEVNHKLQGIVVNHVRDETCKVSYPHVNFSIPTGVFMPAIVEYSCTGDTNVLKRLNYYCDHIGKLWDLGRSSTCDASFLRSKL